MTSRCLLIGVELKAYRGSIKRLKQYYRKESSDPFYKTTNTYIFRIVFVDIFNKEEDIQNDDSNSR